MRSDSTKIMIGTIYKELGKRVVRSIRQVPPRHILYGFQNEKGSLISGIAYQLLNIAQAAIADK